MKFPSISRIINEKDNIFIILGSIFILIAIAVVSFDIYNNYFINQNKLVQKEKLLKEDRFWKEALIKYPDYRDGYVASAKVEYQLENSQNSLNLINKSLSIDPNYNVSKMFEEFLLKN